MNPLIKYLLRWQCSTPILWLVIYWLQPGVSSTIVANLIGGLIFYKIDQKIMKGESLWGWLVTSVNMREVSKEKE
jgi:hypothetical protein